MGELWGVCCEDLGKNWPGYNGTALYLKFHSNFPGTNDVHQSNLPLISCMMMELYSRKVTRRLVGWFVGSSSAASSSSVCAASGPPSDVGDRGVDGDEGGVAGVEGVCDCAESKGLWLTLWMLYWENRIKKTAKYAFRKYI